MGGGDSQRWEGPPVFSEGGGPINRKCTRHYKIKPKERIIRGAIKGDAIEGSWLTNVEWCHSTKMIKYAIDWRGHTTNEMRRVKPDNRNYYIVRWPLVELVLNDSNLVEWARRNGHPEFKWSACEICPFRLRQPHTAIKLYDVPETKKRIQVMDGKIRDLSSFGLDKKHYFNADYLPMDQFVAKAKAEADNPSLFDLFDNDGCDSGECGL